MNTVEIYRRKIIDRNEDKPNHWCFRYGNKFMDIPYFEEVYEFDTPRTQQEIFDKIDNSIGDIQYIKINGKTFNMTMFDRNEQSNRSL